MTQDERIKTMGHWLREAISALPANSTHAEISSFINAKHGEEMKADQALYWAFNASAAIELKAQKLMDAGHMSQQDLDEVAEINRAADLSDGFKEETDRLQQQGSTSRY